MKRVVAVIALLIAPAGVCAAGGINLSWNDCGNAGVMNESFACNTNTGTHTLVASFEPDAPMADYVGVVLYLDVQNTMPVPPWWQVFNSGSCRQPALTANTNFAANTSCADPWVNLTAGGIAQYQIGVSAPNRARMVLAFAMQNGAPISPGTEYYAVKIVISNIRTVGTSSCGGCDAPGCVVLYQVAVDSPTTEQILVTPLDRNAVTWQGSVPYGCIAVPVRQQTWGAIKSLYR